MLTIAAGRARPLARPGEGKLEILEPAVTAAKHENHNHRIIHLIGIGGAAMAPLAGMLAERGYRVTGSDTGVYPPASTLLEGLGIRWKDGFREENLEPAPDLVVIGNALSRGNPEVEFVLDHKIPYRSLPQTLRGVFPARPRFAGGHRHARQDHHHVNARLDLRMSPAGGRIS